VSAEARYYYVDAQNQAAGPIAMVGLLALQAAGTVTDATLVVAEGGTEWVALATLKPTATPPATAPASTPRLTASPGAPHTSAPVTSGGHGEGGSSLAEPRWASELTQKIDQLTASMGRLIVAMEKSRSAATMVATPATAALHAEKINLNAAPKSGIAAQNPAPAPTALPRPTPLPAGVPIANPKPIAPPGATPRPGITTPLSPLAVPANAQKSALPLPALGAAPGPAPAPAKGNIFSKFLKK